MPRSFFNTQRSLAIALTLTFIAALLPGRALGWTRPLAEVVQIVVTPFALPLNMLGEWLRPSPSTLGRGPVGDEEYVRHLESQMREFERRYLAEQAKVEALERQLEQLQKFSSEQLRTPVRPITARVALRAPTSSIGLVTLNRGARHGVKPSTIAVYDAVQLLGQVTDDVSAVQCTLRPITHPSTRMIEAVVVPRDHAGGSISSFPKLLLRPVGNGTFSAEAEANVPISVGDVVRLLDPAWPQSAQAMIVGMVESVQNDDMQPLRHNITVRPALQISQVADVVLKIELDHAELGGEGGAMP